MVPGFCLVDDTRLELVTSRTSSGCATSCANRPSLQLLSYSTLKAVISQENFVARSKLL